MEEVPDSGGMALVLESSSEKSLCPNDQDLPTASAASVNNGCKQSHSVLVGTLLSTEVTSHRCSSLRKTSGSGEATRHHTQQRLHNDQQAPEFTEGMEVGLPAGCGECPPSSISNRDATADDGCHAWA